jgi:hypothetical protein
MLLLIQVIMSFDLTQFVDHSNELNILFHYAGFYGLKLL